MAKFHRKNVVLKGPATYTIPLNNEGRSITCLQVQFKGGETVKRMQKDLRETLVAVGVPRSDSGRVVRELFPDLARGRING